MLLGFRDAEVPGHPKGPGAWVASKLGGLPVGGAPELGSAGAGEGVGRPRDRVGV